MIIDLQVCIYKLFWDMYGCFIWPKKKYHSLGCSWGDLLEDFVTPESLAWSNYGMLFLHWLPGELQALGNHVILKHLKHVFF